MTWDNVGTYFHLRIICDFEKKHNVSLSNKIMSLLHVNRLTT